MPNIVDFFKVMIMVQLFFSFGITAYTYALPNDTLTRVSSFSDLSSRVNMTGMRQELTDNLNEQTSLSISDTVGLVFHSGNLLLDLIFNFVFAIPEMVGVIIFGIAQIINIPGDFIIMIQIFIAVVIMALYAVSLLQLIIGIRSGRIT